MKKRNFQVVDLYLYEGTSVEVKLVYIREGTEHEVKKVTLKSSEAVRWTPALTLKDGDRFELVLSGESGTPKRLQVTLGVRPLK